MQETAYNPSPVQQEFHACQANEILVGGSAGPGKSLALLMDPIQTQLIPLHQLWLKSGKTRHTDGWAIHIRREYKRLEQTIDRSHRMFRAMDSGAVYNSDEHKWTFSCGYKVQFGHVKDRADMENYQSSQYSHVGYDELPELERKSYTFINTRLRSSDPFLQTRLRIVAASNPSPNWVREYFVDPAPDGRVMLEREITLDDGTTEIRRRIFMPWRLKDNPDAAFRRRYEIELQDKPAHIRKALLYGDWYVVAGAFFVEEIEPDLHFVDTFKLPSGWNKFRAMDWGYKSPGVVLWFAVDTDENLTCYRELTFKKLDASELAAKVKEIEQAAGEWDEKQDCSKLSGPADTQIWEERGFTGPTIAETMMERGVFWERASKGRHMGAQQIISRLKMRGEKGTPGIRFFKDKCPGVLRTLPAIGTDEMDREVPQDGGDDHWLDTVMYGCAYRPVRADNDNAKPKDELEERRKEMHQERRGKGTRRGYGYW